MYSEFNRGKKSKNWLNGPEFVATVCERAPNFNIFKEPS